MNTFKLNVTIPANTNALICLPGYDKPVKDRFKAIIHILLTCNSFYVNNKLSDNEI